MNCKRPIHHFTFRISYFNFDQQIQYHPNSVLIQILITQFDTTFLIATANLKSDAIISTESDSSDAAPFPNAPISYTTHNSFCQWYCDSQFHKKKWFKWINYLLKLLRFPKRTRIVLFFVLWKTYKSIHFVSFSIWCRTNLFTSCHSKYAIAS